MFNSAKHVLVHYMTCRNPYSTNNNNSNYVIIQVEKIGPAHKWPKDE